MKTLTYAAPAVKGLRVADYTVTHNITKTHCLTSRVLFFGIFTHLKLRLADAIHNYYK